jgi:membrane associated rhomboid family serine protease
MISPAPRPPREPIFNLPSVVLIAVLALIGIHAVRTGLLSDLGDLELVLDWAVVPVRWAVAYGGVRPDEVLATLGAAAGEGEPSPQLELARYVLAEGSAKPWTGITYAFLHGSWTHVLMNSVWFAAFGTPVARRCGAARFGVLALAAAFGGALAHVLVHPYQPLPLVGASAAVSGMMAGAAWFIFAPPVWLLEGRLAEPHERPRERLPELARNRRVVIFLLVWLGTNYLSAILAQPLGITDASIAWEAHLGGFLMGLLLFPFLDPLDPRPLRADLKRT